MDVLAIGELLIDFTEEDSTEIGYPVIAAHPGGGPPNFLSACVRYGLSAGFIGCVGNDLFGRLLSKTFVDMGVDVTGLKTASEAFTTLAFVHNDENGDRDFSFSRKPGADTMISKEDIDTKLIDDATVFHFGTLSLTDEPSRGATKFAVDYAKSKGKIISFDPNYRAPLWSSEEKAKEAMLWGLGQSDIVKISDNEIEFLFGITPEEGIQTILSNYGVKMLAVTLGERGAYLASGHNRVFVPAPSVKPVDTTGAGDIFGGAALSVLLKNVSDIEAFRLGFNPLSNELLNKIGGFACTAASLSTEKKGGITSVPSLDEIFKLL